MQATGVLYQSLIEQIYQISWPSRTTRDKAIAFVQSLVRKRHMENTDPLEYTDMARVYLGMKLGENYRKVMKPLLNSGILQSSNYYRPGYYNEEAEFVKGQCLSYRINPELLDDEVIKVIYKGEKKRQNCRDAMTMRSKQIMRQIRIPDMNSRELINFVKKSLTDDRIRKMIKVNSPDGSIREITDEVVYLRGRRNDGGVMRNDECAPDGSMINDEWRSSRARMKKHVRVADLQLRTKYLIKDGKHYTIDHLDSYIKLKRRHLTQAYCDQLLRIKHRNVYADRNETNLRLDSNLTNLKSDFMSLLQLDGHRLSQIDLKNSQFRFFVMLLEQCERQTIFRQYRKENLFTELNESQTAKSEFQVRLKGGKKVEGKPVTLLCVLFEEYCTQKEGLTHSLTADYKRFRKLVKTGELYEYIQKIYWTETGIKITRSEAKKLMFTIAFSSYRYCPEGKRVLRKHMPSIIGLIDAFKKAMIRAYANDECMMRNDECAPDGSMMNDECGSQAHHKVNISQEARDKGNASFAIMLQQTESVIFVDKILAECHIRGLKVLSKHDSIVCRQCDKRFVTSIICRTMNQIFGKFTYSLDIDGEVFKIEKKRKSRIHRVATEVVHTLFGVSYQANAPPTKMRNDKCAPIGSMINDEYGSRARRVTTQSNTVMESVEVASTLSSGGRTLSPRVEALRKRIMGG